ncbi:MAG: phosphoribosyltransferase family protein, partial [Carbonactinosporaceae bacterium]
MSVGGVFTDRAAAGRRLGERLLPLRDENTIVLGLPRGGVCVAFQVAQVLGAPLDVIVVRKLGVPLQPELGMGAIGEDGVRIINDDVVRVMQVRPQDIAAAEEAERPELERRALRFRGGRPPIRLSGRTVIVVDDGVATGSTARAACQVARAHGAARVVLAVPVGPPGAAAALRPDADEVVCLQTPEPFSAIGQWYLDFSQTPDEEVSALLGRSATPPPRVPADAGAGVDRTPRSEEVLVPAGPARLPGDLIVPEKADGVVVFAHGSGSSRRSTRNRFVAAALHEAGLGTLLFDLLTPEEEIERSNVFDIELLAGRLVQATGWLRDEPGMRHAPVGYFGAST